MKKIVMIFVLVSMAYPSSKFSLIEHQADFSYGLAGNALVNTATYKMIGFFGEGSSMELGWSWGPLPVQGYVFSIALPRSSYTIGRMIPVPNILAFGSNYRAEYDADLAQEIDDALVELDSTRKGNYPDDIFTKPLPIIKIERASLKFIGKSIKTGEQALVFDELKWTRYVGGHVKGYRFVGGLIMDGIYFKQWKFGDFNGGFFSVEDVDVKGWPDDSEETRIKASVFFKDNKFLWEAGAMQNIFPLERYLWVTMGFNVRFFGDFSTEPLGIDFFGLNFRRGSYVARATFGFNLYGDDYEGDKAIYYIGVNLNIEPDVWRTKY
ncbi:hypothetical protein MYX07_02830 [Patescibacteria group bacterium AH-259-L07]|nr:hypothetical protein [Patescibacteria group bacterium AH-259-L07]